MAEFSEIKDLIVAQGDAIEAFKKSYDAKLENIQKKMNRPPAGAAGQFENSDEAEYKGVFMGWMRSGREVDVSRKSMTSSDDPSGGYLIPSEIDREISKVLREMSPMRQLARVVVAKSGDFSMLHSTGGTGFGWVGETQERPETNTPKFQKISPVIGEIYSNPGLSQNMLDDNGFDLENWIVEELTEAFDAGEGDAFINGNGLVKPRGILTYDIASTADGVRSNNAIQYVPSGASGDFLSSNPADKLLSLVHSLRSRYRNGAAWLMNTNTLEAVRKFKDGQGNYIWRAGLEAGRPDTLLGYPCFEDENMPDVSANSLSIAFGNFQRGYTVVDRSTSMLRDPFTNKPYVHFYSTRRVGGIVRDFRAIKLMKFAAT
jgi:HK97 family phage major capsid protein